MKLKKRSFIMLTLIMLFTVISYGTTDVTEKGALLFPQAVMSSQADEMNDTELINILETILYKNANEILQGWFLSGSGFVLDEESILNPEAANWVRPPGIHGSPPPFIYEIKNMGSIAEVKSNLEAVFSSRLMRSYIIPNYLEGEYALFVEADGKLYYTAARGGMYGIEADFTSAFVTAKYTNAFEIEMLMVTADGETDEIFLFEVVQENGYWVLDNFHAFHSDNRRIRVVLDGQELAFDQPPIIENDRTLVPLRAIFEALGADVEWEQSTRTVTATKDTTVVVVQIDNPVMTVNGMDITLDVPPRIVNSRTLAPVRAVSASFDANVDWYSTSAKRSVIIDSVIKWTEPSSSHSQGYRTEVGFDALILGDEMSVTDFLNFLQTTRMYARHIVPMRYSEKSTPIAMMTA